MTGQPNPQIMPIESKYISQLHFTSTIVRDFLSLNNNNSSISIFKHLIFLKISGGQAPLTPRTVARSWPFQVLFYFLKLGSYGIQ